MNAGGYAAARGGSGHFVPFPSLIGHGPSTSNLGRSGLCYERDKKKELPRKTGAALPGLECQEARQRIDYPTQEEANHPPTRGSATKLCELVQESVGAMNREQGSDGVPRYFAPKSIIQRSTSPPPSLTFYRLSMTPVDAFSVNSPSSLLPQIQSRAVSAEQVNSTAWRSRGRRLEPRCRARLAAFSLLQN